MQKVKQIVKIRPKKWWSFRAWRACKKTEELDNYILTTAFLNDEKWAKDLLNNSFKQLIKDVVKNLNAKNKYPYSP